MTNAGSSEGRETIQLYVQDEVGSVTRPVKELKGFRQVNLQPGESREVRFKLTSDDLSYYRKDMTFGIEPGKYRVFLGGNSRDVVQAGFQLQ